MRLNWIITLTLLILVQGKISAQSLSQKIEDLLTTYSNYGKLNGSVLIADNNGIIIQKNFGYADFDWQIPNSNNTKFRIASISKQFTSMLVLQLVEEGKIGLQDKISRYIPEYPKPQADKITIHQLLSHTSGMGHYYPEFFIKHSKNSYTPDELMHIFWKNDLMFEPATGFKYSSFGYVVLGIILERVTGKTYGTLLQEKICVPLNMQNTGIDNDLRVIPNKAKGYLSSAEILNCEYRNMSTVFATGQIYSTTGDLYKWNKALNTDKLLSEKYRSLMFTANLNNYSYGWYITKYNLSDKKQLKCAWHTGGFNGFNTINLRDMEGGYFITILANAEPTDVETISKSILQTLYGLPIEQPKKEIAKVIAKIIDEQGIEAALSKYQSLKSSASNEFEFNEGTLVALSDFYRTINKTDIEIRLLEYNAGQYPKSSWTYSNLGRIYENLGKVDLAIRYYEKALELQPNDTAAKAYIDKNKKKE